MADEGQTLQTIFKKLWFVIIPAKGLGLLPWRMRRGDRLTREGLFRRMCSIFLVIVSSLMMIWQISKLNKFFEIFKMDKILNPSFVMIFTSVGNLVVAISDIYREFTDAQTGHQIIESLALYDRKVKQLGLARKDNFLFTWIMTLSAIMWPLGGLIELIQSPKLTIIKFVQGFSLLILRLAYELARLKFCIILHLLYQRYKHLNEIVLSKEEWRVRGNLALNRLFVNIRDLVYLHSTLTRATKNLIKVYSFELLIWVGSPIWEFLMALYQIQNKRMSPIQGLTKAAQVLLAMWSLCWICETTANEANEFAMQILKTDPELIRARDIDEQLDAAIYMYNNKIFFRLLNLFDVNLSILVFIGSMTLSFGGVLFDGQHTFQNVIDDRFKDAMMNISRTLEIIKSYHRATKVSKKH